MMRIRRYRGDGGASLILALVLLSLLGIFVASALSFGVVSFENTTVTRSRTDQLYAADGGIEHAVQKVANEEWCMTADASSQITLPDPINGKTVTVTCETTNGGLTTTNGSPLLGDYVAVIGNGGVAVNGGGWGPAEIHGSLRSGGPMTIQWDDPDDYCEDGYGPFIFQYFGLEQHDDYECAWIDVEGSLSVTGCPPQHVYPTAPCTAAPAPVSAPTVRIPSATALPPKDIGNNCIILYPGKYTNTSPTLNGVPIAHDNFFQPTKRYYMASGTYYLSGSTEVVLEGQIFGGAPSPAAPWEDTKLMNNASACTDDAKAQLEGGTSGGQPRYDAAKAGTGVTIVRGSGRLRVRDANTKVELYTRVPATAPGSYDPGATPGVTFWANTSRTGANPINPSFPYTPVPNNCGAPGCEVFISAENQLDVAIHGLSYLANSRANLTEPFNYEVGSGQGEVSFFLGGVAAKTLTITRHYDDNVRKVSLAGTGEPTETFANRTTTVTATAQSTSGGAPTTVTAVVRPDEPTPEILSWRQG